MPRPIAATVTLQLACPPEQLWPVLADSDRVDRGVGLPSAHFIHHRRAEGGEETEGEYRLFGLRAAQWVEHPFEWVRPRGFSIVREYRHGPIRHFRGWTELEALGEGTQLRIGVAFTPRMALLSPLVRWGLVPWALRGACRQYRDIARYVRGESADAQPDLVQQRTPAHAAHLAAAVQRLHALNLPEENIARLQHLLAEAADADVLGMRPLALAERWGADPRQTVETFLHATLVGLLDMQWELVCASCRGVKANAAHLQEIATTGYCPTCNLPVVADADQGLEARFYPAPAVRAVQPVTYCVGSPARTLHRLANAELLPATDRTWSITLPPGHYLLRSPQAATALSLLVEPEATQRSLQLMLTSSGMQPTEARLLPGDCTITIENRAASVATVSLDDERWQDAALTPARLMLTPEFRRLFSTEALAPGIELAVGQVGLLFTDLAGSTALYERLGDATAFRLVVEHFALLREAIEQHGGVLVKTIGDAVMAAFPDGGAALDAALTIQRTIHRLDGRGLVDPTRLVKIGVHAGACFAVTLNDRLDYFGTVVNLAARAQHEAHGGEVVITASTLAAYPKPLAAVQPKAFEVYLRGIALPVVLHRLVDVGPVTPSTVSGSSTKSGAVRG